MVIGSGLLCRFEQPFDNAGCTTCIRLARTPFYLVRF